MKIFLTISFILNLVSSGLTQNGYSNFDGFYLKTLYEVFYFNITTSANFSTECIESLGSLLLSYGKNPIGWPEKGT